MIKPQDLLIVTSLATRKQILVQKDLASLLFISQSDVSEGLNRCEVVKLIDSLEKSVNVSNLMELIVHSLKYFYPVEQTGLTRGVPTAWGTSPLLEKLKIPSEQPIPVWAHAEGTTPGIGVTPFHKNVPRIALKNALLHKVYALVDAIRMGKAREREMAIKILDELFRKKIS